ncbi:MAG: recombination-associated protein RdgC [Thermodesulfobacteriota bacterium]
MGLQKGAINLTRYQVPDQPSDLGDEFIQERLTRNAFVDIETGTQEESAGWVEVLEPLAANFNPVSFRFGDVLVFGLRIDTRRVPAKTVSRYLTLALAEAEERAGKPLSSDQRRQLKSVVHQDLLARTPVSTDVYEVCWFTRRDEVWLVGGSTKVREKFEELWRRTFKLGLLMKIPYVLARELLPGEVAPEALDQVRASALIGGRS